jgi:branched-chain amino acid aminotransferase
MVEIRKMEYVWMDGRFIPSDEAKIPVTFHTIHYGDGLFEGIRCYRSTDGRRAIFRLDSHIHRMLEGANFEGIKIPYSLNEIHEAIVELAKKNNVQDGDYIRPLALVGEGHMGPFAKNNPVHVVIINWAWGQYFGEDAFNKGISVMISKKTRRDNRVLPFFIKSTGQYVNSRRVKKEAEELGYDDGLVKDLDEHIVEASASNIFIVKDRNLITPSEDAPILRGITRKSIIAIAQSAGFHVEETYISENRLFSADEVFLCGTAVEFIPIRSVAEQAIGKVCPGPMTKNLRDLFFQAARGKLSEYKHWLTYID